MESQMKDVPADKREKIMAMIEKNPDLFQKIAAEVQEKMKNGAEQFTATMEVMKKYQEDLKKIL